MKKILAIITLLSIFSMQLVSYAEDNLYFEMDLSAYTAQSPVVKNKVTNTSDGITVYGRGENTAPLTDTVSSVEGETKYITTGKIADNAGAAYGMICLDNSLAQSMATSDELTIEFWTKSDTPITRYRNYKLFKLASAAYADADADASIEWELNIPSSGDAKNRFAKTTDGYSEMTIEDFPKGEWTHWVLTRKFNTETNTFDAVVYVNATQAGTASGGQKTEALEYSFSIGGAGDADKTYQGSIGEFRVYKKALDSSRIAELYNSTKAKYQELPKAINLVSPENGTELKKSDNELTVEFDNYIDKQTLSEIEFLNADETIFEGATMNVPDGITKTVTFELEGLTEGSSYILRIGEVKSINQYTVTPQDISITVFDSAIVGEDFTDWDVGEMTTLPQGDLVFCSSGVVDSVDDFAVRTKTAGGKTIKYLEMKSSKESGSADSYLAYDFGADFNKDFVVEVGVRGTGDATSRSIRVNNGASNHFELGIFTTGSFIASSANGTGIKEIVKSYDTSVKDDHGFLNLVFTFVMEEDGTYRVYGTSPDNEGMNYEAKTKFSKITQIKAMNQYHSASDTLTTELSHFKIYEYVTPKISSSTVSQIKKDSDFMEFKFDDDMTGFTNDSFKLSKADGTLVDIKYEGYDSNARTAKIKINEYLDFGAEYELTVEGPKNLDGTGMRKSKINFTVPGHEVETTTSQNATETTISMYNNASTSKTVLMTTVMYNAEGKILKAVGETITIPSERRSTKYIPVETGTTKTLVYVFDVVDGEYRATTAAPFSFES